MFRNRKKKSGSSNGLSTSKISNFEESPSPDSFAIKTSKHMGRYIIAAKNFKPGEIILREGPLVVGPCTDCKVQCLGCYKILEENGEYTTCSSCGWLLCNETCSGLNKPHGHSQIECITLAQTNSAQYLGYKNFAALSTLYQAIAPLRCLLLKASNIEVYKQLTEMEDHNRIRKNIPEIWENNQTFVVDRIRKDWGLAIYSEEEIHTMCGILEVNAFEIGQNGVTIRGVYPSAYLMSHDCVPNTNHTDEENGYVLTVRASIPILHNYPITLSYAYTLQDTMKRREHLLGHKFFQCRCERCCDRTELGTFISALQCPKCKSGWVLQNDPLDLESSWKCDNYSQEPEIRCSGYEVTSSLIRLLLSRVAFEADNLDCNDIEGMEHFLDKYRNVLHPTHYLCLGIKLSLSQLYGKIPGFLIHDLTVEQLNRKKEICQEILKVFDIIEPGYTRIRGVTLYELHAPIMMLVMKSYKTGSITKPEFRTELKKVVKCLDESYTILSFEPKCSHEHTMSLAAKEALGKIRQWEKWLGKL